MSKQKSKLLESGFENTNQISADEISSSKVQVFKSMFPLTIGMVVGVLGGVALSYIDDNAKVSTPPLRLLNTNKTANCVDTSKVKKLRSVSSIGKQQEKILTFPVTLLVSDTLSHTPSESSASGIKK